MRRRLGQLAIIAHKIFPFITFYPKLLQLFWPPFYRRVIFINIDCMSSRRGHYTSDPPRLAYTGDYQTRIRGVVEPQLRGCPCQAELLFVPGSSRNLNLNLAMPMVQSIVMVIMMIVTMLIIIMISCDMLNPGRRSITAAEQGSAGREKG